MTSILLILIGWVGVHAQEITYNLEPTHELGPELWSIPIGGRLTMSADGTRMLVASLADSAFYVVDVETGQYRRLSQPYYQDNTFGFTLYVIDNDLKTLSTRNLFDDDPTLYVWDVESDTLLYAESTRLGSASFLKGVSGRNDRLVFDRSLIDLKTGQTLTIHELLRAPAWFDDDRGVFYCSRERVAGEFDAVTGELLRSWPVRSALSEVRRPSDSDWLYVFSLQTDFANPQNWVEAINLVTGDRMTFERYFWTLTDGQPIFNPGFDVYASTPYSAVASGRDGFSDHIQPVWRFDAEAHKSDVVIDPLFYSEGDPGRKPHALTPSFDRFIHTWWTNWKDSSITRCNALIPVATSMGGSDEGTESPGVTTYVTDDFLYIEPEQLETIVLHVDVATIDGAVILQQDFTDPVLPVRIPIDHLASGTYVCSVQTSVGRFSSTFAIQR